MTYWILAPLAVLLVGIAKAGFGGGVGIIAVPLFIIATQDSKAALGIMLPLLCACYLFALYHYRRVFDSINIYRLLPGIVIGIALCGALLGKLEKTQSADSYLQVFIGFISLAFVFYQWTKTWILKRMGTYRPTNWHGWFFGFGIGVSSTLAHAAGPVSTMFLFPQKLGRQLYVGTTVVLFTIVNAVKLIPYFYHDMINLDRIKLSLMLLPFVPVGTFLGVWMNRKISEKLFNGVIYSILFLLGIKLITGFEIITYLLIFHQAAE